MFFKIWAQWDPYHFPHISPKPGVSLVEQPAEKEGIAEQLKAQNQMAWVGAMNSIRNQAEEIINAEIIYT